MKKYPLKKIFLICILQIFTMSGAANASTLDTIAQDGGNHTFTSSIATASEFLNALQEFSYNQITDYFFPADANGNRDTSVSVRSSVFTYVEGDYFVNWALRLNNVLGHVEYSNVSEHVYDPSPLPANPLSLVAVPGPVAGDGVVPLAALALWGAASLRRRKASAA